MHAELSFYTPPPPMGAIKRHYWNGTVRRRMQWLRYTRARQVKNDLADLALLLCFSNSVTISDRSIC